MNVEKDVSGMRCVMNPHINAKISIFYLFIRNMDEVCSEEDFICFLNVFYFYFTYTQYS